MAFSLVWGEINEFHDFYFGVTHTFWGQRVIYGVALGLVSVGEHRGWPKVVFQVV